MTGWVHAGYVQTHGDLDGNRRDLGSAAEPQRRPGRHRARPVYVRATPAATGHTGRSASSRTGSTDRYDILGRDAAPCRLVPNPLRRDAVDRLGAQGPGRSCTARAATSRRPRDSACPRPGSHPQLSLWGHDHRTASTCAPDPAPATYPHGGHHWPASHATRYDILGKNAATADLVPDPLRRHRRYRLGVRGPRADLRQPGRP